MKLRNQSCQLILGHYIHIDSCLVEVRTKVHLPLMGRRRSDYGTFSSHLGDVFVPAGGIYPMLYFRRGGFT